MQVNEAANRIAQIEAALSRVRVFRGFRSLLVMTSALSGTVGALAQPMIVGPAMEQPNRYVIYWSLIAAANVSLAGAFLWQRSRRDASGRERRQVISAVGAILPHLVTGGFLTLAIVMCATPAIPLLPGLWAVLFGLGILSSRNILPAITGWGGFYYITTGLYVITLGAHALEPFSMLLTFCLGQAICACLLFWSLERKPLQENPNV